MKLFRYSENCLRKLSLIIISICVVLYICVYMEWLTDNLKFSTRILGNAYCVNQVGCIIPSMSMGTGKPRSEPPECQHTPWFKTKLEDGKWIIEPRLTTIFIAHEMTESLVQCRFASVRTSALTANLLTAIEGDEEFFVLNMKWWKEVPRRVTLALIECFEMNNRTLNLDVYSFVHPPTMNPRTTEKTAATTLPSFAGSSLPRSPSPPSSPTPPSSTSPISVMILGISGASHRRFLRKMPMTAQYIRTNFPYAEFFGFNKMGDHANDNIIPLLYGMTTYSYETNYKNRYERQTLWRKFKKAGYKIAYGESNGVVSLFGHKPPGHFNLNPHLVSYALSDFNKLFDISGCQKRRLSNDLLMNFVSQVVPYMAQSPFFSYFWWWDDQRRGFDNLQLLDAAFVEMLRDLYLGGIMNNTFIVLVSDQGPFKTWREPQFRTFDDIREDRQPVLFVIYPPQMEQNYPEAIANLKANRHSLVTAIDLYATMMDVLQLGTSEHSTLPPIGTKWKHNVSLIHPIPAERDCESALIWGKNCICHQPTVLSADLHQVRFAAQGFVMAINKIIKPYPQCSQLRLFRILRAELYSINHLQSLLSSSNPIPDYELKLRLVTQPGEGIFASTMRLVDGHIFHFTQDIQRIDYYRNNSSQCMSIENFAKYCHCK